MNGEMPRKKTPLGEFVRRAREARGWSQAHLAGVMRVSERTVQRVEAGAPVLTETLKDLAAALDTDFDILHALVAPHTAPADGFPLRLIVTGDDLVGLLEGADKFACQRLDLPEPEHAALIGEFFDLCAELPDIADLFSPSERMRMADDLMQRIVGLAIRGWLVLGGAKDEADVLNGRSLTMRCAVVAVARVENPALRLPREAREALVAVSRDVEHALAKQCVGHQPPNPSG